MDRFASVQWRGGIKEGQGVINSESGVLSNISYSYSKRFGQERGTNPEELIAAAHASCFTMALSGEIEKRNMKASVLDVKATVTLDKVADGWSISASHLDVTVDVPGGDPKDVEAAAKAAKENCPVSKLLNAKVTMDFHLSSENATQLS
jgi:lipoyl-dependent peroxiredoxin